MFYLVFWRIEMLVHRESRCIEVKRFKQTKDLSSQRLLYGLFFAVIALIALVILEVLHMIIFNQFNDQLFAALSGLIGTIIGALISHKAKY